MKETRKRQYPEIDILGETYLADWVKQELRPKDSNKPALPLAEMEIIVEESGNKALRFPFELKTASICKKLSIRTKYPDGIFMLEIPFAEQLDPEGFAIKNGYDPDKFLNRNPVPLYNIAKVIPWESTRYKKEVEFNREHIERKRQAKQNEKKNDRRFKL